MMVMSRAAVYAERFAINQELLSTIQQRDYTSLWNRISNRSMYESKNYPSKLQRNHWFSWQIFVSTRFIMNMGQALHTFLCLRFEGDI